MSPEPLQVQIQTLLSLRTTPTALIVALKAANSDTLLALISQTGSTGTTGAEYEAVRETAIAILQARSTDKLVRSATFLSRVGIFVAVVIGVAQILVPLFVKH